MSLYRVNPPLESPPEGEQDDATAVPLAVWLDSCQNEYDALVARLRHLDEILVTYKRKRHHLLPKRIK